jgi:valyl-tRNA synthetase
VTLDPTPNVSEIEERCRALWEESGIYLFDPDGEGEVFSVDTPPPYVSAAHLHVGHAMSYSQAEFIVRYQRMRGKRVYYPMGFDDNGLPTERFVETTYQIDKSTMSRSEFRQLCLEETSRGAAAYERLWRKLGISVDWRLRYSTIDEHCRRTSQRSFLDLLAEGRVYRSDEPVFWDPQLETALAQADLETITRKSRLYDIAFTSAAGEPLVISTTRPELLPACVALYYNPGDERYKHLAGTNAVVPVSGHEVPIRADDEVLVDFGTGLMQVCTFGDGMDVQRWKRDGLDLRLGVDGRGRLTDVAGPYAGLSIEEGRKQIVEALRAEGRIVDEHQIEQQVHVSERSQRPVEFQMRPHWYVRVLDLREELLARAEEVVWRPQWMRSRLESWVNGLKYDWNITRQRFYGVPFPIWYCRDCATPLGARVEDLPVDPLEDAPPLDACPQCGGPLDGDPDVMDTWMTSSLTPQINTNWAETPDRPLAAPAWPLTLRVQAYEIIRTWLFYTLVKAHLHADSVPWTHVMLSGLGLNEQGKKLSKRDILGKPGEYNRYDPEQVIDLHGADALRYWAAGSHLGNDTRYNEQDVKVGRKLVLKLWNVARFIEQYLGEFDPARDQVPVAERTPEDRWVVGTVEQLVQRVSEEFDVYDFAHAREHLDRFFWNDFADDYIEMVKDRFWSPERHSEQSRNSARSTLRDTLRTLLSLYAPLVPFITEELYQLQYRSQEGPVSLHAAGWPAMADEPTAPVPEMEMLRAILDAVRAERTKARISQSKPLAELVLDLSGADEEVRRALEQLETPLLAASRSRSLRLGPVGEGGAEVAVAGVRVEIVLGTPDGPAAGGRATDGPAAGGPATGGPATGGPAAGGPATGEAGGS